MGVPDQTSAYTTALNFQETVSFGTPDTSGGTTPWAADIRVTPGPAMFGSYTATCGTASSVGEHVNTTFGANTSEASKAFVEAFERWRLMYCGVTVYVDAPALANQGNIVAAQHVARPLIFGRAEMAGTSESGSTVRFSSVPSVSWQPRDTPDYGTIIQMPNSFSGLAKDGCYMPLRLDSNHARWHDVNDVVDDVTALVVGNDPAGWTDSMITIPRNSPVANDQGLYPASVTPHITDSGVVFGTKYLLPCTSQIGSICISGITASATVRIVYRVGIEAQAQPGSAYSPFLKMSLGWDPVAVADYYAISRRLKDGYPSDYNDFGKLWSVIKGAAKAVAPALEGMPGHGIIKMIGGGDERVSEKDRRAIQAQPSAVDKAEVEEIAKEAVKASLPKRGKSRKAKRRAS